MSRDADFIMDRAPEGLSSKVLSLRSWGRSPRDLKQHPEQQQVESSPPNITRTSNHVQLHAPDPPGPAPAPGSGPPAARSTEHQPPGSTSQEAPMEHQEEVRQRGGEEREREEREEREQRRRDRDRGVENLSS
ncbi:unnamed protein product [Pleuronectes platessa]|uniref:Uncharacterized protein n=1 Tax=Pleuronectes platessa TaxID=8262 RepID=A0A9N7VZR8_PLEPL|nr:unnamed protein product [Pleuronectes platessa]